MSLQERTRRIAAAIARAFNPDARQHIQLTALDSETGKKSAVTVRRPPSAK